MGTNRRQIAGARSMRRVRARRRRQLLVAGGAVLTLALGTGFSVASFSGVDFAAACGAGTRDVADDGPRLRSDRLASAQPPRSQREAIPGLTKRPRFPGNAGLVLIAVAVIGSISRLLQPSEPTRTNDNQLTI